MKLKKVVVDEVLEEKKADVDDFSSITFYGVEPESEEHVKMIEELKYIKNSDPELYRNIINMD